MLFSACIQVSILPLLLVKVLSFSITNAFPSLGKDSLYLSLSSPSCSIRIVSYVMLFSACIQVSSPFPCQVITVHVYQSSESLLLHPHRLLRHALLLRLHPGQSPILFLTFESTQKSSRSVTNTLLNHQNSPLASGHCARSSLFSVPPAPSASSHMPRHALLSVHPGLYSSLSWHPGLLLRHALLCVHPRHASVDSFNNAFPIQCPQAPFNVSYVMSHTSCLIRHVSYFMSPMSCLLRHVSYVMSPTSCLLRHVSYVMSPTSCLLRHVSYLLGALALIITLPLVAPYHQPASFVFQSFFSNESLPSPAYSFVLCLLVSQYSLYGYDGVAHLSEETKKSDRTSPAAIVASLSTVTFVAWLLLVVFTLCIQNVDDIFATAVDGETPTTVTNGMQPVIQILWDAFYARYGSGVGAQIFTGIIYTSFFFGTVSGQLGASRVAYALARDGGLPFSFLWRRLAPNKVPVLALLLSVVIGIIFLLPLLYTSTTIFFAIASISSIGWVSAYSVPIFFRFIQKEDHFQPGPFYMPNYIGVIGGKILHLLALVWVLYTMIAFLLPLALVSLPTSSCPFQPLCAPPNSLCPHTHSLSQENRAFPGAGVGALHHDSLPAATTGCDVTGDLGSTPRAGTDPSASRRPSDSTTSRGCGRGPLLFLLPYAFPVTVENLNWAPVAIAVWVTIFVTWWIVHARFWFKGPVREIVPITEENGGEKEAKGKIE
ncbi:unnamed protein product [Closterium sp. NIES-54]